MQEVPLRNSGTGETMGPQPSGLHVVKKEMSVLNFGKQTHDVIKMISGVQDTPLPEFRLNYFEAVKFQLECFSKPQLSTVAAEKS
jgi:hypothetical protein